MTAVTQSTAKECEKVCEKDDGCVASTFESSKCYVLKQKDYLSEDDLEVDGTSVTFMKEAC